MRDATGADDGDAFGQRVGGGADRLAECPRPLEWRPYEYFTCRFTPLGAEDDQLGRVETWSLSALDDNRTDFRLTLRGTDRSAEGMVKFEQLASRLREQASQPEYGAAVRAAIAEDAAAFGLDEPTG